MDERIEEILSFWFGDNEEAGLPTGPELWFSNSARVDRTIEKRFGKLMAKALSGDLEAWGAEPRGRLAVILLLDQFPRLVHRESPRAFEGEQAALQLCFDGLDDEMDQKMGFAERCFFYQPAMNAEDTDAQLASVEVYAALVEEAPPEHKALCERFLTRAERSRDVVERFDRFPQRNNILGRSSTTEESAFLQHTGEL